MTPTHEFRETSAPDLTERWRWTGAITGLLAVVAYGVGVAGPLPYKLEAIDTSLFGPLLACASIGLYHVLASHHETILGLLAAVANVTAGALVTAMLMVQLALDHAVQQADPGASTERIFDHIHFGLDLAWDTFLCIGTVLFGLVMSRRPGFGPLVGGVGVALGIALYVINFSTFPEPPGHDAVDLGPVVGLWYAVVSALMFRRSVVPRVTAVAG